MISELQLDFQATGRGRSQAVRILECLQAHAGEWVPMPELAKAASRNGHGEGLAVHSRINDLRHRGYEIEHKNVVGHERVTQSFYRLVSPSVPSVPSC